MGKDTSHPSPSYTRYAKVAGAAIRVGAGMAGNKLTGQDTGQAVLLRTVLGGLKGPLMKVAQLLSSIPDFLPREYAAELATLQSDAPPMGWPFVRRRMTAELGSDWETKFADFERHAVSAASLGQVHRARSLEGAALACKLQYPDMGAVIESDLNQLKMALKLFDHFGGGIGTDEAYSEIAERLREELDYKRESHNMQMFSQMLADQPYAHVPNYYPSLSTDRLLTMDWLEGRPMIRVVEECNQEERNSIAKNMFRLWYMPFYHYGIIHGDPHLGNYTVAVDESINLLDFGCVRVFDPAVVSAVVLMFEAMRDHDEEKASEAYRLWGFKDLSKSMREALHLWAQFVYGPFLKEGVSALDETNSTAVGRKVAAHVYDEIRKGERVTIPRSFVMIDRASVGLGGLFLRLGAQLNWHDLFHTLTEHYEPEKLAQNQSKIVFSQD